MTESLESLQRLAIGIEYDGTAYSGWQYQPHAPSIQQCLNKSISVIAATTIECVGAGRTDAGVHATGQVAHFDSPVTRAAREWLLGINSNLPDDICVLWVQPVGQAFHARFSALKRTYRYSILNQPVRSALSRDRAWWVRQPLDTEAMQAAGNYLLGTHDFSAFRASSCQANTPVRTMGQFTVSQSGAEVTVECSANAFLHHMVRNIVGSLVKVGLGEAAPEWVAELIDSRDRKLSGITAPACGLALTRVEYPSEQLQVIEFKF